LNSKDHQEALLAELKRRVIAAMQAETLPDQHTLARLARDYRSYQRMGHAPARAIRLAEQILFQQRDYASRPRLEEFALDVTATLAEIYEEHLK